jgi:hypothetical protein
VLPSPPPTAEAHPPQNRHRASNSRSISKRSNVRGPSGIRATDERSYSSARSFAHRGDPGRPILPSPRQAIARAMYFKSKVLILDEPTNHLSVEETAKVLGFVKGLAARNVTWIFVSHNLHYVFVS